MGSMCSTNKNTIPFPETNIIEPDSRRRSETIVIQGVHTDVDEDLEKDKKDEKDGCSCITD